MRIQSWVLAMVLSLSSAALVVTSFDVSAADRGGRSSGRTAGGADHNFDKHMQRQIDRDYQRSDRSVDKRHRPELKADDELKEHR